MDPNLKIAFVHDALPFWGGAEKVLAAALEVFPQAELYTLVYQAASFRDSIIARRPVHTSFIDRLPAARSHHRAFLPLMPLAIERLDLHAYDILVSFSYAVAHGVRPLPGQLHISYMHTPLRYAWGQEPAASGSKQAIQRFLLDLYLPAFRRWDAAAARRTGHFVSVSRWIAQRVWQAYRRTSDVLYPPVNVDAFRPLSPRADYYLVASRLVAHKRVDLAVETFSRLGLPLFVVGSGPEEARLRRLAGPSVQLLGWQPQAKLAELYGRARAFIHPGVEDFGIAMVEAQAAGCPVIALQAGAAPEIVTPGQTGALFANPTSQALQSAVLQFEAQFHSFDPRPIQQNARRFSVQRFQEQFAALVEGDWMRFPNLSRRPESPAPGIIDDPRAAPASASLPERSHGR